MGASLLEQAVRKHGAEAVYAALTQEQRERLKYEWAAWARPEQLEPPGNWRVWMVLAGRGWGKSRVGAETVRGWALNYPGCHIALIGRTAADVRDVMVRALMTPWRGGALDESSIPDPFPASRSLLWKNGSRATTYSAEEPRQLLGQQHDFAWCDEMAAWPSTPSKREATGARSVMEEVWHEGLMLGFRGSGECKVPIDRERVIVTTTPRPKKLIRELLNDPRTIPTRGSTYENARNLPAEYIADIKRKYEGTRVGRQEVHAELLDDVTGALWTYATIDDHRVTAAPQMTRIVVAVDPSGKSDDGDEQGIVVCGLGEDGHGYVLADYSTRDTPDGWGKRAIQAYQDFKADRIVGERNFGGDMVGFVIQQAARSLGVDAPYRDVSASRGKQLRAEPVSALYEQGRVHHVGDGFELLEEQMRGYTPDTRKSPDRLDALVWALTDLMVGAPYMGASAEYDSPMSDAYWERAEEAKRATNLKGFV